VRRAYKVAPVDAVQVEYNPWQLDIENETGTHLLATCRELGVTVFAYSPLGRGFLTGQIRSRDDFAADDFRRMLPRFNEENFPKNLELVDVLQTIATKKGVLLSFPLLFAPAPSALAVMDICLTLNTIGYTAGQLALAWLVAQGNDIVPIPGTKKIKYLEENVGAAQVKLSAEEVAEIRTLLESIVIAGARAPSGFFDEYADSPAL